MKWSSGLSVLIASFSPWIGGKRLPINGNVEPLLDFFVPKIKKTVLIDQVYPGSDFVLPRIEVYKRGKRPEIFTSSLLVFWLQPLLKYFNYGGTHVTFKLRDYLSVVDWGFRDKTFFDLFIGLEAVNALAGVLLRAVGKVKTVVYYVSDYSPVRYKSKWFNSLYLWLDRQAAVRADFIWDVSPAIQPARLSAGLDAKKSAPVLVVPNALFPYQIKPAKPAEIVPYSLVFMGTLGFENGPDLAIEALPYIMKKIPQAKLHIIGGGEDEKRLKKLTGDLRITDHVTFHGFIADREKVSAAIRCYMVALAPYVSIPGSARFYGDATKIRAYMAAGLPTITTYVPPLGKEVVAAGAAMSVEDNPCDIANAVIKIFSNQKLFREMSRHALEFAKNNTWEKEFTKAFASMREAFK